MDIKLPEIAVDILLNIINIVVLFIIVKALVYKPVKKFLDNRKAKIKEDTESAQKLVDAATDTLLQKDALMEEGRAKGEKLAAETCKKAQEKADAIIKSAKNEADSMIKKAQAEIDEKREDMIKSSKDDIADLSVDIAEKILKREISKEDNMKIVEDFFNEG